MILSSLVEAARHANENVLKRLGIKDEMVGRRGGYYCFADRGLPIFCVLVGEVPELIRRAKYLRLSQRKCEILYQYHAIDGHFLSRESANDDEEKFAGAVQGRSYQHGFSGYPADVDEIISALVASQVGDTTRSEMRSLLSGSNRYFHCFVDLFAEVRYGRAVIP